MAIYEERVSKILGEEYLENKVILIKDKFSIIDRRIKDEINNLNFEVEKFEINPNNSQIQMDMTIEDIKKIAYMDKSLRDSDNSAFLPLNEYRIIFTSSSPYLLGKLCTEVNKVRDDYSISLYVIQNEELIKIS